MKDLIFNGIQARQIMDMGPDYWKIKDQILNSAKKGLRGCVSEYPLSERLVETLQKEGFSVNSIEGKFIIEWAW